MTTPHVEMIKSCASSVEAPRPAPAQPPMISTSLGAEDVTSSLALASTEQDLTANLPRDTALLRVIRDRTSDNQPCFRLDLSFRGILKATNKPHELENQRRPRRVLADELDTITKSGPAALRDAVDYYANFLTWCAEHTTLAQWLKELRSEVGSALRLVIWDDTDFGVPWELFRYEDADGTQAWLGATAQVIRWTMIRDPVRRDQFSAETVASKGPDVLYFEHGDLIRMNNSSIVEQPPRPWYRSAPSLLGLLELLMEDSDRYGLVYVRCHGEHGKSVSTAKLGGIELQDFESFTLPALRASRSVVFLNTCNSARQVMDIDLGTFSGRSFAEIFLRHHAAAVIATLGEIPVTHSAMVARKLVRMAKAGGVCVPEQLRAHRARYAEGLPKHTIGLKEDKEDKGGRKAAIQAFLIASTIVYFGHPDSTFVLRDDS